jgi:periplasmic protein TonB
MFDLITQKTDRPFREPALLPRILSMTLHVAIVMVVIAIPLLTVTNTLPEAPSIVAFVTDGAAPPPTPPPPPPPAPRAVSRPTTAQATPSVNPSAAPLEAPADIRPEQPVASTASASTGVAGGVEGGVEGGVVGGIVGGMVGVVTPPPPPPPAQAPVRIGGQIKTPALLHRVEPVYPDIAAAAHLTGLVILEAVVDATGCVESVKVLRSGHPLLDREAVAALKQWRYTPLMLNGTSTPFVLTVTFNFNVAR